MIQVSQSNPQAYKNLIDKLQNLQTESVRVGWFDTAHYPDGDSVADVAQVQEFGNPAQKIPPRPFMRPTIMQEKSNWVKLCEVGANKVLEGKLTTNQFLNMLGLRVAGQISKTIANVYTPALSLVTIMARKARKQGKVANIGKIREQISKGDVNIDGVSKKPLVDTGLMLATLTHVVSKE